MSKPMAVLRILMVLPVLMLLANPARACWDSPTAACFGTLWQDQALSYHAEGPAVQRLYDLIDWGVVPPGEDAARGLLEGLHYDDLVAHHEAEKAASGTASQPSASETEHALRQLLGLSDSVTPFEVNPDYLFAIYQLARSTNDRDLSQEWFQHLPDYIQTAPDTISPDGTVKFPDPYVVAQSHALAALSALAQGRVEDAARAAAELDGEPAFLTWLALTRHAIGSDDTVLLARAVRGLSASMERKGLPPFAEEALKRAMKRAEIEYGQTGDPDALVHALESADPSAHVLPVGARITTALAERYLNNRTGTGGEDGFDAAFEAMQLALQFREDEDDATPMLNARTALRLGMVEEADRLIAMVDAHFPGVASSFLYDLPREPAPWAEAWLDRMIARFDHVAAEPNQYERRAYWDIWLDQNALETAIDITQTLARYDRRDDAYDFADRAQAYLRSLPVLYPNTIGADLAALFDQETAAFLYPPDVAIPRMRNLGMDEGLIAHSFAKADRADIALILVASEPGYRALGQWIDHADKVADPWREDYIAALRPMIEEEAMRLVTLGYPELAQAHHVKAAVFYARLGDWPASRRHYDQITDELGTYGPSPAAYHRLTALRDIVAALRVAPAPMLYPYEDFAL